MSTTDQEKARQARNAYHRAWRANHREKVREINQRYWLNRAKKEETKNDADIVED